MASKTTKESSGRNSTLPGTLNPIISSTLIFVTSFIITQFLFEATIAVIAAALQYSVKFHYSQVELSPMPAKYWGFYRVFAVHMTGPFLCLVGGFFLLGFLKTSKREMNVARLYFFWLMVCLLNLFLTPLTTAPLGDFYNGIRAFYRSFAIVGAWLSFKTPVLVIFAGVAIIFSLLLGYFIRDELFKFDNSRDLVKSHSGQIFIIFKLFLLPIFLGALPLLYLSNEASLYPMAATLLNLGIISVGMLASSFSTRAMTRRRRNYAINQVPYFTIGLAAAAWVGVYLFLR
jgi:hypothetical protein